MSAINTPGRFSRIIFAGALCGLTLGPLPQLSLDEPGFGEHWRQPPDQARSDQIAALNRLRAYRL